MVHSNLLKKSTIYHGVLDCKLPFVSASLNDDGNIPAVCRLKRSQLKQTAAKNNGTNMNTEYSQHEHVVGLYFFPFLNLRTLALRCDQAR